MSNEMGQSQGTWLFDLGNTRLKFASLRVDGDIGEMNAITHHQASGPGEFDALPSGQLACVASVAAPRIREALLTQLEARFERVLVVRTEENRGRLRIAYPDPDKLGVDRFLALLAACARGSAALVVGVGTAVTIDLVDADGLHRGGRIAPSPELMRNALHQRVPQLPATGGEYLEFADDTPAALASGCEGSVLALVERSRAQAVELLGEMPQLLLHGGGSGFLQRELHGAVARPALVLEGLAEWAKGLR